MYQRSDGNSSVQRQIEEMIFRDLEKQFCIDDLALNPSLSLPDNPAVKIKPDFYSEAKKIIGDIHNHRVGGCSHGESTPYVFYTHDFPSLDICCTGVL